MKNYKNNIRTLSLLAGLFLSTAAYSQIIFDDDVDDGTPAPIDGFVSIGIAAGTYLGYKKLKRK